VLIPLEGEQIAFGRVAVLAAGYDVALLGEAATYQGYDVIHGELTWWDTQTTVMAAALTQSVLPPLAATQIAGSVLLAGDMFV
jgi:hypothetical protein